MLHHDHEKTDFEELVRIEEKQMQKYEMKFDGLGFEQYDRVTGDNPIYCQQV